MPERYLKDDKFDRNASLGVSLASFGFGRRCVYCYTSLSLVVPIHDPRICPGQEFSKDALFSIIASTLSVYDIKHKRDEYGREVPITDDVVSGFVS